MRSRLALGFKGASVRKNGMLFRRNPEFVVECMMPDFFHVVPIRDDTVLNGILQRQNAALALSLVTDITVLLVHTDHDAWHLGPADNRREHSARCIVTSETGLTHATAVVDDERGHFLFGHVSRNERTESVWAVYAPLSQ